MCKNDQLLELKLGLGIRACNDMPLKYGVVRSWETTSNRLGRSLCDNFACAKK